MKDSKVNSLWRRGSSALMLLSLLCLTLHGCGSHDEAGKATADKGASESSEKEDDASSRELPKVKIVKAEKKLLNNKMSLPGQLEAYQNVPIHAKVEGYIQSIVVDRGSVVKKGDKLLVIFCPELKEKLQEAEAKVASAKSTYERAVASQDAELQKQAESSAKLDADQLTYSRLTEAAKTPGAVAKNDVDQSDKTVEADKAAVSAMKASVSAAKAVIRSEQENITAAKKVLASMEDMQAYLTIRAPFDGVITERNVHEGSIVAVDASRDALPLVRIQQKSLLRLVVAVPEGCVSGLKVGQSVPFTVPAYVGKVFHGGIARLGFALDTQTRTMPVELDAWNKNGELEPGMFATVEWPISRPYATVFLPSSAVATDLKGTFVIKVKDDVTTRVAVTRGQQMGQYVEVVGDVTEGDNVALKATDELKTGTKLIAQAASEADIAKASGPKESSGGE